MNRKKKKITNQKIKLLALFVSVILLLGVSVSSSRADTIKGKGKQVLAQAPVSSDVVVNKTASKYDAVNDKVDITLTVDGKVHEKEPIKADIVLCVDTSGSMNKTKDKNGKTRLDYTKEGIKKFCSKFKEINGSSTGDAARVKVALCEFNGGGNTGSMDDARDCGKRTSRTGNWFIGYTYNGPTFTGNMDDITLGGDKPSFMSVLSTATSAGTNTEAGIKMAGKILSQGRADAKKYIILFTDGLPTVSIGNKYSKYSDKHFIAAQEAYNELLGGIDSVGGIVKGSKTERTKVTKHEYTQDQLKFYTIAATNGLESNKSYDEPTMMNKFLSTLNNTGGYKNVNNDEQIQATFGAIAQDISQEITNIIAKNPVIRDEIPEQFAMPTDAEINQLKEKYKNSVKNIRIEGRGIVFELKDIKQSGNEGQPALEVDYSLKPANNYFYGENIPTNVKAVLNYKDPENNSDRHEDFPVPNVTITPNIGKITVDKRIVDSNGNWIDSNENETFPILLKGIDSNLKNTQCAYNFNMTAEPSANSTSKAKTMEFIMKDYDTDINAAESKITKESASKPEWGAKLGWVGVGTYDVSEIVPMNYALYGIEVYYDGVRDGNSETNKKIIVDEKHKNITIIVKDQKVNDRYWYDKDHEDNQYPKDER